MLFIKENTPAYVVKVYPQASDLFNEYSIDFCCEGEKPIEEQCSNINISPTNIIDELNERYTFWKEAGNVADNWDEVSLDKLIEKIVTQNHVELKDELGKLNMFVTRVNQVHGADQPHLGIIHELYNEFRTDLETHMDKANNELFSLVKEYTQLLDKQWILSMSEIKEELTRNHETIHKLLNDIRKVTDDFEAPAYACGTYRVTYDRLAQLESKTYEYIHLENNILFQRLQ